MSAPAPWLLINGALTRLLSVDPDAEQALLALAPCALVVEVRGFTAVHVAIESDSMRVAPFDEAQMAADVFVSGGAGAFMQLLRAKEGEQVAALDALTVNGDVGKLAQLQKWLASVDIDWEELLAQRIGDVAAHQVGNFIRHAQRHVRQVGGDLQDNVAEYLLYETQAVVSADELERWARDVDMLRNDVDRLQARVNLLTERQPSA